MRAQLGLLSLAVTLAVCERSASASPTWREIAKLTASEPTRDARFGYAVALEGNTLVVGAPGPIDRPKEGAVYVFTRANTSAPWALTQKLTNPTNLPHGGGFGSAVALRGDVLAVGSPSEVQLAVGRLSISGELNIFERSGGTWNAVADFWDLATFYPGVGATGQNLGTSVACDGKTIAAGEPGGSAGDVVAFAKSPTGWVPYARFGEADATSSIGRSVAISSGYVATGNESAGVYAYGLGATPTPIIGSPAGCLTSDYGTGLAFDGDTLIVTGVDIFNPADLRPSTGLVALYKYSQITKGAAPVYFLTPGVPTCTTGAGRGTLFGSSVGLRGDRFVVGAPGDVPEQGGAVQIYMSDGTGGWRAPIALRAANLYAGDRFGASVAIDGDTIVVGAPAKSTRTANDGAAFVARYALPEGDACTSADQCHSGSCVDGVCCADACGGGKADDCVACSVARGGTKDGVCTPAQSSVVCRASAGECDVEDRCDGFARECPADATRANGSTCSSGVCIGGACAAQATDTGAPPPSASGEDGGGCATAARNDARWMGILVAAALTAIARRRRSR